MSARRQGEFFRTLTDPYHSTLRLTEVVVCYDWKEKLKIPQAPEESGALWHAQQKMSLSCWGGAIMERKEEGQPLTTTFFLFVTENLEQTCEASIYMLSKLLHHNAMPRDKILHLWQDCGPHFRAAETLHYFSMVLPQQRKNRVTCNFLAEQHGKSTLDQMFGLASQWVRNYALKHNIFSCDDMVQALAEGARHQQLRDPVGPTWVVQKVVFPRLKSAERRFLYAPSLKITRTYSLEARPCTVGNFLPRLYNGIFSDNTALTEIHDYRVETVQYPSPEPWRTCFFEGNKPWEGEGPQHDEDHHLKRVWQEQKHVPCPRPLLHTRSFQDRCQAIAKSKERAKRHMEKRIQYIKSLQEGEAPAPLQSSSSESSSSTSSADEESDKE